MRSTTPETMPDTPPAPLAVAERSYIAEPGLHRHAYFQLIFPRRGGLLLSVEGRRLSVGPATWALIPAGVPHVFWAEEPNRFLVADVATSAMAPCADAPPDPGAILRPLDARLDAVATLLQSELRAGALDEPAVAESLAAYLGAAVALAVRAERPTPHAAAGVAARAREFIEAHATEPIGLEMVAAAVGASVAHVQRSFRAAYGATVVGHLQAIRLRRARELLRETDMPVEAVAAAVGFASASYFTRLFTREVGVGPGAYRRR